MLSPEAPAIRCRRRCLRRPATAPERRASAHGRPIASRKRRHRCRIALPDLTRHVPEPTDRPVREPGGSARHRLAPAAEKQEGVGRGRQRTVLRTDYCPALEAECPKAPDGQRFAWIRRTCRFRRVRFPRGDRRRSTRRSPKGRRSHQPGPPPSAFRPIQYRAPRCDAQVPTVAPPIRHRP